MQLRALIVAAVAAVLPFASCSKDEPVLASSAYYENDELGLAVDDFDWSDPESRQNEDGEWAYFEDAKVALEGKGTHDVLVEYWEEIEDDGSATNVEILVVT